MDFPTWLRPELFSIGPFALRWYALAYIAGLLLGWRYILALIKPQPASATTGTNKSRLWGSRSVPLTPPQLDDFLFWATLGVILGGRIGYVLFYMLPSETERAIIAADPLTIIKIWEGGMSFHGGLIGVALAIAYFARKLKIPLLSLGDLVAAATPIGLFFGRLANFVNAELYGRTSDVPWAMRFPEAKDAAGNVIAWTAPRHPSQLYEAFLEGLLLFIILRFATHRFGTLQKPGLTAGIFLAGYCFFRLLVEFVREPDRQMPEALRGYVTMGMLLCLPMIALGAFLAWRATRTPSTASA
jgi:phosphatidylglycerol---prolipoprotein diacylglyceryl transferase